MSSDAVEVWIVYNRIRTYTYVEKSSRCMTMYVHRNIALLAANKGHVYDTRG